MRFLIIDIETTGLSCSKDRITAIGTIVYDDGVSDAKMHKEHCFNVDKAYKTKAFDEIATMKREVAALFDASDQIVAFNGVKFDFPFIIKWLDTADTVLPAPESDTTTGITSASTAADSRPSVAPTATPVCTTATPVLSQTCGTPDTLADAEDAAVSCVQARPAKRQCTTLTPPQPPETLADTGRSTWPAKYLDFCLISVEYTKKYISLKNLCNMNCVKATKSGTGLDAIEYARTQQWEKLEKYCQQDVRVLLELTERAVSHGLVYPCKGYAERNETVHVEFDAQMHSSVVPAAAPPVPAPSSVIKAMPRFYLRTARK